ncbi:single-stranded DNA-binding protein [Mucilaginibacter sp. HMF5004]|nr:single-stranded DNA-binding protein [Mucilaginibacter rivuli]
MSTLKNSVRLVGNLGMDPEVKNFDNNRKLVKLALATSESYKNDKGEKVTETNWHNIVIWGAQAKFAEDMLKKGDEVAIDGKLASRSYVDKDGNKRYVTEVVANEFLKMNGKRA